MRMIGRAVAVGVVAAAVAAGAYWAGLGTAPSDTSGAAPAPAERPTRPQPAAITTPDVAAGQWLRAQHGLRHTDAGPDAWINRVLPVVTGQAREQVDQARGGSGGADWQRLRAGGCTQQVTGISAVVPPEAPSTGEIRYVQVSGQVEQTCAHTAAPEPYPVAATVETTRDDRGRWRVSAQLH